MPFSENDVGFPDRFRTIVECKRCQNWYHLNCEKIPNDVITNRRCKWRCSNCVLAWSSFTFNTRNQENSFIAYFPAQKFIFVVHELNPIFFMRALCDGCVFHSLVGWLRAFSHFICSARILVWGRAYSTRPARILVSWRAFYPSAARILVCSCAKKEKIWRAF